MNTCNLFMQDFSCVFCRSISTLACLFLQNLCFLFHHLNGFFFLGLMGPRGRRGRQGRMGLKGKLTASPAITFFFSATSSRQTSTLRTASDILERYALSSPENNCIFICIFIFIFILFVMFALLLFLLSFLIFFLPLPRPPPPHGHSQHCVCL